MRNAFFSYCQPSPKVMLPFLALTIFLMAYSSLIPVIPIVLLYLMWAPFAYYNKEVCLKPGNGFILPFCFLILCCLSSIWSDYRSVTLYSSIQYASMICIALIVSRRTSFETFLSGLSFGVFLVLIATFHTGSYSYEGLFGSKNQVGYFAEIGLLSSSILLFSRTMSFVKKLFLAVFPLCVSFICLLLSHSASSVITIFAILSLCLMAFFVAKFPSCIRMFLFFLISMYFLATFFAFHVFDFDPISYVLDMFGKEKTLTGRTDLWDFGLKFAGNSPFLGVGYNAFWVKGRTEAEYLWEIFFIANRTGFHFHNLYVQTLVDLGFLGVCLIALMLILFFSRALRRVCVEGANIQSIFLFGISSIFLSRSFVEVDILSSFGLGPLLFYACYPMVKLYSSGQEAIGEHFQENLNYDLSKED